MTNQFDTVQFRNEFRAVINALEALGIDPNNLRQLLFGNASQMANQLTRYLNPMAERYGSQLKSKLRASTRLENGMDLSDSQDHKAEIENQIAEIEARLSTIHGQMDECLIIYEECVNAHDRIVIETGKGDLFADIREKADKKRAEKERLAELGKGATTLKSEASLDKATAESDVVKKQDALAAKLRAIA